VRGLLDMIVARFTLIQICRKACELFTLPGG
jgi:hypothetical protein